jgi:hypothetical protein
MDSFIVDDDNVDEQEDFLQRALANFKKKMGAKQNYSDYSSSDMEAGYDEIQYEEKQSMKIARKEDAVELMRIQEEEMRERMEIERRRRSKR